MNDLLQDIRYASRLLARSPGFFAMAVGALALGIGANTAVFSAVHSVLLKPLPYPDSERLALIFDVQSDCATCPASYPKYIDWRQQNRVFEIIGGSVPTSAVLTGAGEPERIGIALTTATLFRVLDVQPILGRWFRGEEDAPGGRRVMILSYGFWQQRFGADPRIIDKVITLDDVPREVIGVMPAGFSHRGAEAWVPLAKELDQGERNSHFLTTYGRLAPGVSLEQARKEMAALGERLDAEKENHGHGIAVAAYRDRVVRNARTPLLVLLGSVVFILLIACANVANLLLARGAVRRREIAVRSAMGATRTRLARQLLTESLLLSISGALLGVLLAHAGLRFFVANAPPVLPRMESLAVDANVLVFTCAVAVVAGLLFGLAPVLHVRNDSQSDALKEEGGRSSGGPFARSAGSVLVVAEISLSIVLLVGAALLVKSLTRLQGQDLGVTVERVVAFDIRLPSARYESEDSIRTFYRDGLERLESTPGVVSVGAANLLPLRAYGSNSDFDVEGKTLWKHDEGPLAEDRTVAGDYFQTMGIPLVRGRYFDERDDANAPPVIVINEVLAERCWPVEDPVGKYLVFDSGDRREVVGVVGNVRTYNPGLKPALEFSRPLAQSPSRYMTFVVRSAAPDPTALVNSLRLQIGELDPTQPLSELQTMEQIVHGSLARPRLISVLISSFAGLAGLLALVGVYGLVSFAVSQQSREMGIRMAMGAEARDVLGLVLARGLKLALTGTALGILASLGLTRLLASLLYEVAPGDPVVLALTSGGVLLAAIAASLVPARTASRIDPAVTLRS